MKRDAVRDGGIVGAWMASAASVASAAVAPPSFFDNPRPEQFFAVLAVFAAFGALSRLLYKWDPTLTWQRFIGSIMVSVFAALMLGFFAWDVMHDRPMYLMAGGMAAGWIGGEGMDALARTVASRTLPTVSAAAPPSGPPSPPTGGSSE